jgi:hypothetical protein
MVADKVKDAHEFAVQGNVNLAALRAWDHHDLADERAQRVGGVETGLETSHLMGASTTGFARQLPGDQQKARDLGLVSVVAREGPALSGKTPLACEFVSNADRAALKQFEEPDKQ